MFQNCSPGSSTQINMEFEDYNIRNVKQDRHLSVFIPRKHRLRLWAALRWAALVLAVLFSVGYIGIVMLLPPIAQLPKVYPDILPQIGFYIHVFPGAVWLILGALQFFSHIRGKNPRAHRIIGYISLACLLVSVVGGVVIVASGKAEGGDTMSVFGILFFSAWLVCGAFGYYYMRCQYNIQKHREWMLRAYFLSYAIVLMRPGVLVYTAIRPELTTGQALALVGPLLWTLTLIVLEIHIRRERANQVNTETHLVTVPAGPVSEEDGEHQLVNYQRDFVKVTLVHKHPLTHNTALFVFKLPVRAELLMFPGHHVVLRRKIKAAVICRPYSPVTSLVRYFGRAASPHAVMRELNQPGTVALAIKKYDHGALSSWLHDSVNIGDSVDMMGPSGGFYYFPNEYTSLGLVAGGTGITPIMSLLLAALQNINDRTTISLVLANSTEQDVIFHDELEELARLHPNRLTVTFVAGSGRVTRSLLQERMPQPGERTLIAVCGPVGFATSVQKSLAKLKHEEHNVHTFGETDK